MVLSRTLLGQWNILTVGIGSFTTGSFTPPNNSLIVVVIGVGETNGITDPSPDISITDSSLMTWTSRYTSGNTGNGATLWSAGQRVFTTQVLTGTPITLTVDCAARDIASYLVQAFAYTGHDTTTPIGAIITNGMSGTSGSLTLTLPTAPSSTSEILAFLHGDLYSGNGSSSPGTGWTELYDINLASYNWLQSQYINNTTSPTISWVSINNGTGSVAKTSSSAIEIKAAPTCPTPNCDFTWSPTNPSVNQNITVTSSDPSIVIHDWKVNGFNWATTQNTTMTFSLEGTYNVQHDGINSCGSSCTIIKQIIVSPPILSTITISGCTTPINSGSTCTITSLCTDQLGYSITCPTLSWQSSNPLIATVSSSGIVTAIISGTTIELFHHMAMREYGLALGIRWLIQMDMPTSIGLSLSRCWPAHFAKARSFTIGITNGKTITPRTW